MVGEDNLRSEQTMSNLLNLQQWKRNCGSLCRVCASPASQSIDVPVIVYVIDSS